MGTTSTAFIAIGAKSEGATEAEFPAKGVACQPERELDGAWFPKADIFKFVTPMPERVIYLDCLAKEFADEIR